ncbi:hypothetical protein SNEBB_003209 [Seison nebaliae]|nr:hypothetical protein SNEBB_003209 [Seison nebaliae]
MTTKPSEIDPNCNGERRWYVFLIANAIVFIGGIIIILVWRAIGIAQRRHHKWRKKQRELHEKKFDSATTKEDIYQNRSYEYSTPVEKPSNLVNRSNRIDHEPDTISAISTDKEQNSVTANTTSIQKSFFTDYIRFDDDEEEMNWVAKTRDKVGEIIGGQNIFGKFLSTIVFLFSMASVIIYIIDCYTKHIEWCTPWVESPLEIADTLFNITFALYFILRFIAAQDKLIFWVGMYSLIDHFTIPNSFISVHLNHHWIGFRFLRIIRLLTMPEVLQHINILRTNSTIRLFRLTVGLITLWLTAAGFVHLVENSGDPFKFQNSQPLTFGECAYFIMISMSTVGYGDFACKTSVGRSFMVLFSLAGLAMFGFVVSEVLDILSKTSKYSGTYKREQGKKHVIVCGHITSESIGNFLKEFLHEDRERTDIDVVVLHKAKPSLDLENALKKHFTRTKYFEGTVMNPQDLHRVEVRLAEAVFILANKSAPEPDEQDMGNIMRVISIKNSSPKTRIIIQLLQYHNKLYLLNVPTWDIHSGDAAVCIDELKMGFLAQSCLCPGFSTMMANIFSQRSTSEGQREKVTEWMEDYISGTSMEMYATFLSNSFVGKTFPETVKICFTTLKLHLIAIETFDANGVRRLLIFPGGDVKIIGGTRAFFITDSADDAKRAYFYCEDCHKNVTNYLNIKKCSCKTSLHVLKTAVQYMGLKLRPSKFSRIVEELISNRDLKKLSKQDKSTKNIIEELMKSQSEIQMPVRNTLTNIVSAEEVSQKKRIAAFRNNFDGNGTVKAAVTSDNEMFDETGMFHWCPTRTLTSCLVKPFETSVNFKNHVLVLIFADEATPMVGLRNFVMPLRASNFRGSELKDIIFVTSSIEWINREWAFISNFNRIYVVHEWPNKRRILRWLNIDLCDMAVIMSPSDRHQHEEQYLTDKSAILCSLNVKAMRFTRLQMNNRNRESIDDSQPLHVSGDQIPMITDLENDLNVQYLESENSSKPSPQRELYLTMPFACGTAFASSVLDSIVTTAFFNADALKMISLLITGGTTPELETMLAEEGMVKPSTELSTETLNQRNRCRLVQICISTLFSHLVKEGKCYGDLFVEALDNYQMLCLGLYRFRDAIPRKNEISDYETNNAMERPKFSTRRFVICNPSYDYILLPSDMVFVLQRPQIYGASTTI